MARRDEPLPGELVASATAAHHIIERTPCLWDDSDVPELEANSRMVGAGFELADVAWLI